MKVRKSVAGISRASDGSISFSIAPVNEKLFLVYSVVQDEKLEGANH